MSKALFIFVVFWGSLSLAERGSYGEIYLNGLARESFDLNPPGPTYAMVCNVNGPDGFLTVRSCASTSCSSKRQLLRLAIVSVDSSQRRGRWVKVLTALRTHDVDGYRLRSERSLHVTGWVHDNYLCDFLD